MNRLYAALRHVGQAILFAPTRERLFGDVCQALVEQGGFRAAWVGWFVAETQRIVSVADCGDVHRDLEKLEIVVGPGPAGQGSAATAFREDRPCIYDDMLTEPNLAAWRSLIEARGVRAAASFPIRLDGTPCGALTVYADEPNYFRALEIGLFSESAATLSFALQNFARQEEQARTAERLARSEQMYRELVETANSIILRWTGDGTITFVNKYGLEFFGYAEEELVGRHVMDTIVPPTESGGRDLSRLMDEICADPKSFEQNVNENIRRNGERVWIAWTNKISQDAAGRVTELLSIGNDITERRRAAERVRQLNEDLRRHAAELDRRVAERTAELALARDRAEAADRTKSAFLATMSHELRTPLNSIIGFTGIVLQGLAGPLTEEQRKQLGMVRVSARHLLALINDVLDISKIEAGELEIRPQPFDLAAAIASVVETVRPLAQAKGLTLEARIALPAAPFPGDRRRVEQVLLNLLNNAIKFTEHGGVTLTAGTSADPAPAVAVRVADTGIGIRPGDLGSLFQPFRQIETGLARPHEGTGLGLAICHRLATLMGGRILVESEWRRGSAFTLLLPLGGPAEP